MRASVRRRMLWVLCGLAIRGLRACINCEQRSCLTFLFFFFFQAEDGIRDLTVTGVQTCALPISHPLSPLGLDVYDFALGDTTTIVFPEREVRVVALRVRPKRFDLPRIVGTLYLDATAAELVRMAFNFTPRAYLDPQLEDVSVVLDNALWEQRWWLPYHQEIEIRRRATWLDVPARGIIRGRWEIDGYVFNLGLAPSWFAGDEITF